MIEIPEVVAVGLNMLGVHPSKVKSVEPAVGAKYEIGYAVVIADDKHGLRGLWLFDTGKR